MKALYSKLVKRGAYISDNLIIGMILTFLLALLGQILGGLPVPARLFRIFSDDPGVLTFMGNYASFYGIWVTFMLVMAIFWRNRPMFRALLPVYKGNNLKGILLGTAIGFGTNGFCILMSVLLGRRRNDREDLWGDAIKRLPKNRKAQEEQGDTGRVPAARG